MSVFESHGRGLLHRMAACSLLIGALVFVPKGYAILGSAVSTDDLNEATCRILFYDASNQILGFCSGILIERDTVLTAGHCLKLTPTRTKIVVGCGNRPDRSGGEALTHEVTARGGKVYSYVNQFKETREVKKR